VHSISGPSTDEKLQKPRKLLRNLQLSFIGISLVSLDNLISHLGALLQLDKGRAIEEPYEGAYLSIGARAIFQSFGIIFFVIAMSQVATEVLRTPLSFEKIISKYFRRSEFVVLAIVALNIIANLIKINVIYSIVSLFILGFIGLLIIGFELYFLRTRYNFPNILVRTRYRLIVVLFGVLAIYYLSLFFFIRPNQPPENWPTRNPPVEIYMFLGDLWAFFTVVTLYCIIFIPKTLREHLSISHEEYLIFRDERFDYEWHQSHWSSQTLEIKSPPEASEIKFGRDPGSVMIQNYYDTALEDGNYQELLKSLAFRIQSYRIISYKSYGQSYFQKQVKTTSDLFFFISEIDESVEKILDLIYNEWGFKISLGNNLIINNFQYQLDDYCCTLLMLTPSLYNIKKRMYLVVNPKDCIEVTCQFIDKYWEFLNTIAENDIIFLVVKFPVSQGKIENVPSSQIHDLIPHEHHLIFL
jgi:hypothetical protein